MTNQDLFKEIIRNQQKIMKQNAALLEQKSKEEELLKQKIQVPTEIREAVRTSYTTLKENIEEEEENELQLWDFEKGRRDPKNVETTVALMKMVKGIHPDAHKGSIRVATHRYYTSLYEAHIKKKNQFDNHLARQRKYERRKRKLSARKIALKQTSQISETKKVKYERIMMLEYMSSENSDEDEHGQACLIIKKSRGDQKRSTLFLMLLIISTRSVQAENQSEWRQNAMKTKTAPKGLYQGDFQCLLQRPSITKIRNIAAVQKFKNNELQKVCKSLKQKIILSFMKAVVHLISLQ